MKSKKRLQYTKKNYRVQTKKRKGRNTKKKIRRIHSGGMGNQKLRGGGGGVRCRGHRRRRVR